MKTHIELLGPHPVPPSEFDRMFNCVDHPIAIDKRHRELGLKFPNCDAQFVDWLARRIILHHYEDSRIAKIKAKYNDLGFPKYSAEFRRVPNSDKVRKGNATEVLLVEYIEACYPRRLVKVFKLRFNPNVDQSMKGDDALLLDYQVQQQKPTSLKLIMGEAKFRVTPAKQVVEEISSSLSKDKEPLSYSFVLEQLAKDPATEALAEQLEDFIVDQIKRNGDIIYVGLLLSNERTSASVETHLSNENPNLLFVSAGITEPAQFVHDTFARVEWLLANPGNL